MGQAFDKLTGDHDPDDGDGHSKEAAVAKTAGLVVFSGIVMSILKTLNPHINNKKLESHSVPESTQPTPPSDSLGPITKEKDNCKEQNGWESSRKTVEIVKGDTLWGLSRKHGVSIDAIKEANGLTGDTIYAGKKLIIP